MANLNEPQKQPISETELLKRRITELEKIQIENKSILRKIKESEIILETINAQLSSATGIDFFNKICNHLSNTLQIDYAFIGEISLHKEEVKVIAGVGHGSLLESFNYKLDGTPCENLLKKKACSYPSNIQSLFPKDKLLIEMKVEGYLGIPLSNRSGKVFGIMVLLHGKPIENIELALKLLNIFSDRVATEVERNQSLLALQKSEEKYKLLLENQTDIVVKVDTKGNFEFVSQSYCKLFGKTEEELIGNSFVPFIHNDDREQTMELRKRLYHPPHFIYIEQRAMTVDGWKWLEWTETALLNEDGNVEAIIGIGRDITKRKKIREHLKEALQKAEESDHSKSVFLAIISHELRTPLNAIIGFSELLNKNMNGSEVERFGKMINNSGELLLRIANDLFEITLIESREIINNYQDVIVQDIFEEVYDIIGAEKFRLNKSNIRIYLQAATNLTINTDTNKLKQILLNLLKNAIKFTEQGSVNYGCEIVKIRSKLFLQFFVKDTGIGIAEDKQAYIFDIFKRVKEQKTHEYGGTGIGLSVVKKMVVLLGGDVWLESEKNKGSNFYFTLPYRETIENNE